VGAETVGAPYATLSTDLDIKEGQKVVVGKVGIDPSQAMFLVLMAHVIQ
jgi:antitoxin component of RelBE/YafQ-DinJ toxin-antitoxin module